jgi:protein TonB
MQMLENERKQTLAIVLSLVLHGLLAIFVVFSPYFASAPRKAVRQTEVELIDSERLQQLTDTVRLEEKPELTGQIVEQNEKAINDERDKEAKFLSRHNQKVVRETKAAAVGRFRNTDSSAGEKSVERLMGKSNLTPENRKMTQQVESGKTAARSQEKTAELANTRDGVPTHARPTLKDLVPSFKPVPPPSPNDTMAKGGGEGLSTNDDHIKDVTTGMQTLLSTREFVYYTYYNRIKDKLRQYWEPKIKEKMEHIMRQGRRIASNTERITRIVIVLDNTGTLIRVQIIGPSGLSDLDDAAAEAFRAAAPFPNPPKGIVDSDGTIKIRWDFILEA